MTNKEKEKLIKLCEKISDGIEEYAETLETTDVIRDPLDKLWEHILKIKTED